MPIDFIIYLKNQKKDCEIRFNVKNNLIGVEKEIDENKYILNLNSRTFNKISAENEFRELILYYEVENQSKFLLMPFFMLFTWFLSLMEILSTGLLGFPYVMMFSALIVYLNLVKENYQIPYIK